MSDQNHLREESSLFSKQFSSQLKKESQKWQYLRPIDENNLGVRCTRFLLKYGAPFFGAPIYQEESYLINRIRPNRSQFELLKQFKAYQLSIFLSLYIYLYIGTSIYLNYKYNWHNLKLKQLMEKDVTISGTNSSDPIFLPDNSRAAQKLMLEKLVLQDEAALNFIGSPYLDSVPFLSECIMIIGIIITTVFADTIYMFNFIGPFNFGLIRMFLDSRREQKVINKLTLTVAREFEISSRNYVQVCLDVNKSKEAAQGDFNRIKMSSEENIYNDEDFQSFEKKQSNLESNEESDYFSKLLAINLHRKHNQTVQYLKRLLLSGRLQPKNMVTKLVKPLTILYGPFFYYLVVICLLIVIALLHFQSISSMSFDRKNRDGPMDKIGLYHYLLCAIYGASMTCFYGTLFVSVSLDQNFLVCETIKLIEESARTNTRELQLLDQVCCLVRDNFFKAQRSKAMGLIREKKQLRRQKAYLLAKAQQHGSEINRNILICLLHYKQFVRQFRTIRDLLSFLSNRVLEVTFMYPALILIHSPLLDVKHLGSVAYCYSIIIFGGTMCYAPICYLHCRFGQLYKKLYGLIAQTMYLSDESYPCEIINAHLIWQIKKELEDSEKTVETTSISCYGYNVSYTFLLRVYFWFGIITLSLIYAEELRARTGSDLLTQFFKLV